MQTLFAAEPVDFLTQAFFGTLGVIAAAVVSNGFVQAFALTIHLS